jgi:RNA polymerase sigma-70 factor (ECF subfamily)
MLPRTIFPAGLPNLRPPPRGARGGVPSSGRALIAGARTTMIDRPPDSEDFAGADLSAAFRAGCADGGGVPVAATPALGVAVAQAVADGRAAWPAVRLAGATFAAHLGRLLATEAASSTEAVSDALGGLQIADLFLACACAHGLPAALAEFETRFLAPLPFILRGLGAPSDDVDSVAGTLRHKLLVREGDDLPRIGTYAGRAPLATWVATAAQRIAVSQHRSDQAHRRAHDRAMTETIAADLDPELRYMKARYRDAVESAVRDAISALSDRDRALLSLAVVGGLSLETLGASYQVNASTVSRWLAKIRRDILERATARLREALLLEAREAASIVRLVQSQLDVSVARLLRPDGTSE